MFKYIGFALFLAIVSIDFASASRKQFQLPAEWREPASASSSSKMSVASSSCTYAIVTLIDDRSDPNLIGIVDGRELIAPSDRMKWLRSMLVGLRNRGLDVTLPGDPTGSRKQFRLAVKSAWVDHYALGFTGAVDFEITSLDAAQPFSKQISGRVSTTEFLGTMHHRAAFAFQRAVAKALDNMVPVMTGACQADSTAR